MLTDIVNSVEFANRRNGWKREGNRYITLDLIERSATTFFREKSKTLTSWFKRMTVACIDSSLRRKNMSRDRNGFRILGLGIWVKAYVYEAVN